MLSVLIPVYNYDVRPLVNALQRQCTLAAVRFEIRCYEDGSTDRASYLNNQQVGLLNGVIYQSMPQNLGRAKIRNLLGEHARYPYLLFMDCDTLPLNDDFIVNYIRKVHPNKILYGGRAYAPKPPADRQLFLHWYYGKKREAQHPDFRREFPYRSFMTNNFLVPAAVFKHYHFDDSLQGYGHEDTLYGHLLGRRGVPIVHLNNPLLHLGLERNTVFLRKQREAIDNLYQIAQYADLTPEVRLLRFAQYISRFRLEGVAAAMYKLFARSIERQLCGKYPILPLLDAYKLFYWCGLKVKNRGMDRPNPNASHL